MEEHEEAWLNVQSMKLQVERDPGSSHVQIRSKIHERRLPSFVMELTPEDIESTAIALDGGYWTRLLP
jgi:hypothetical protein